MKKFISCVLAFALIFSLAACQNSSGGSAKSGLAGFMTAEEDTLGKTLLDDFASRMDQDSSASALSLAEGIIANEAIAFMGAAMEVEPGFLSGFQTDITDFQEGAVFAPMISTIPFVGYIFVLEDSADVNAFATNLKEQCDPRWNICTEAEQTVIDYYGNTVFFLMCPKSLES
ncbi:MAG: hypothetical protein ACI4EG_15870 [Fusicatenibacter sp.]|nr:hypothetical protein [Fusicatenibacter sp.]